MTSPDDPLKSALQKRYASNEERIKALEETARILERLKMAHDSAVDEQADPDGVKRKRRGADADEGGEAQRRMAGYATPTGASSGFFPVPQIPQAQNVTANSSSDSVITDSRNQLPLPVDNEAANDAEEDDLDMDDLDGDEIPVVYRSVSSSALLDALSLDAHAPATDLAKAATDELGTGIDAIVLADDKLDSLRALMARAEALRRELDEAAELSLARFDGIRAEMAELSAAIPA